MHAHVEYRPQRDRIEGRRNEVVAENEPIQRQGRGDPCEERLNDRGGLIRGGCRLEQRELVARVEVGSASKAKAFETAGLVRHVERADRRVAPVERQYLQPRLPDRQGLPVPVAKGRQLRRRGSADGEIDVRRDHVAAPDDDAALPEQAGDLDSRRPPTDDGDRLGPERGSGLTESDLAVTKRGEKPGGGGERRRHVVRERRALEEQAALVQTLQRRLDCGPGRLAEHLDDLVERARAVQERQQDRHERCTGPTR